MTIDEMAKLEQEHKDRIANMTAEYEKGFDARTATFMEETKRLSAEITRQQAELRSLASAIAQTSTAKNEMDLAIESLNKEVKAKYETNALLSSESDEVSAKYSERRARMERDLEILSRKSESVVTEIALANATLKQLKDAIVAKQEEVKAKGAEVACYLASLSAVVTEAEAKKEALLAEVDDLLSRRAPIVASIQSATTDLDAINARIEAAKVDMATADADLDKQRELYTENITKFKDLDALRSDMQSRQIDIKFREDQIARKQKALNDQEQKLKTMAGGV